MRLLSLYLKPPIAGISDRRQFPLTLLPFQDCQDFFFCIRWNNDHTAAQASQTDALSLLSSQKLKDWYRADLRSHFLLRTHNRKLLLLYIITKDQKPHAAAHTLILFIRNPSDTFQLSLAFDQNFLHYIFVCQT